jgi:tetratricopeptide (TPR) repeat protein
LDIGHLHFSASTQNPDAQTWFDRGVTWMYSFNKEEAVHCFEQAVAHDPDFAMGWWALSLRSGATYTVSWAMMSQLGILDAGLKTSLEFLNRARACSRASPLERELIDALVHRYPEDTSRRDFTNWDEAYATAMRKVYQAYPENPHVVAIFGEALMLVTPWNLWDPATGKPASGAHSEEAREVFEAAMRQEELSVADGRNAHPGIHHLYCHLMEMSPLPELAIPSADHLRHYMPDSGHLSHMPSHIDVIVGDYRQAVAANARAIDADRRYIATKTTNTLMARVLMTHNALVGIYAAMFSGQYRVALHFAEVYVGQLSEDAIAAFGFIVEPSASVRIHVLVRFGRWEELKALETPKDQAVYPVTTAVTYYARGIAYAATGEVDKALREREAFVAARERIPPQYVMLPDNKAIDVMKVPLLMLDGEIAYRQGRYDVAFGLLRDAISVYDNFTFGEPWAWMQPVRHAYAALKLEQGDVEDAARVYAEDLGFVTTLPRSARHPNNVWALHGYHECMVKLGRQQEVNMIKPQVDVALAVADVKISSSCFCRNASETKEGVVQIQNTDPVNGVGGTGAKCCS